MLSFKAFFTSKSLRAQVRYRIDECLNNVDDDAWWEKNTVKFRRELECIGSRKEVSRAIYHARHHDDFYLRRLRYELGKCRK